MEVSRLSTNQDYGKDKIENRLIAYVCNHPSISSYRPFEAG